MSCVLVGGVKGSPPLTTMFGTPGNVINIGCSYRLENVGSRTIFHLSLESCFLSHGEETTTLGDHQQKRLDLVEVN